VRCRRWGRSRRRTSAWRERKVALGLRQLLPVGLDPLGHGLGQGQTGVHRGPPVAALGQLEGAHRVVAAARDQDRAVELAGGLGHDLPVPGPVIDLEDHRQAGIPAPQAGQVLGRGADKRVGLGPGEQAQGEPGGGHGGLVASGRDGGVADRHGPAGAAEGDVEPGRRRGDDRGDRGSRRRGLGASASAQGYEKRAGPEVHGPVVRDLRCARPTS
jgi:hypothetical protein